MRKLWWLAVLLLFIVFGNFGLWFWHTRLIIAGLDNMRYELRTVGLKMEYEEVRFTNFKAWQLDAKLQGMTLQNAEENTHLKIGEVHISSLPLEKKMHMTAVPQWEIKTVTESEPVIVTFDTTPQLDITFRKSLRDFNKQVNKEIYEAHRNNGILRTLQRATLNTGKMEAKLGPTIISSWQQLQLEAKAWHDGEKFTKEIVLRGTEYKSDFSPYLEKFGDNLKQKVQSLAEGLGSVNFTITQHNVLTLSEDTKAALKERLGDNVDPDEIPAKYDAEYYESELDMQTTKFKMKLHRITPISGREPKAKWEINISGYHDLAQYIQGVVNVAFERLSLESGKPILPISDAQITEIIKLLAPFEKNADTLAMTWTPFDLDNSSNNVISTMNQIAHIIKPNLDDTLLTLSVIYAQRKNQSLSISPLTQQ